MPKLCIKPKISETMNVKGHRKCVTVVYPPSYQYFKIPDGVDLNDLSVVREWFVRDDILNIHFKDSNKDSIFEQPHYTDIYGDDDKEERIEDIDEAGQEDMYEDEDQSDEEEEEEEDESSDEEEEDESSDEEEEEESEDELDLEHEEEVKDWWFAYWGVVSFVTCKGKHLHRQMKSMGVERFNEVQWGSLDKVCDNRREEA